MKAEMKYTILLLASFAFFAAEASSQCRAFTKRNCLPIMEEYTQNDNYNAAVLIPGDAAELDMAFYGGVNYRVVVCSHPVLGAVEFGLYDSQGNSLWENTDGSDHVDLSIESTQQLSIRISVPESDAALIHEGCVSIMLGSKD
ncbi:MAG: hypothetical protein CL831_06220 [Crocinitomicaceae bacterium]|nr:hypothetical protein [Crocinitomicaceae bacterium]|tara:strand:- start:152 stop:580 length:429 start_codon:yes stop_codon:yes gene_type:complete